MSLLTTLAASAGPSEEDVLAEYRRAQDAIRGATDGLVDATIGYRLRGYDVVLREAPLVGISPDVASLTRAATLIRQLRSHVVIDAVTANAHTTRLVHAATADILYVEITTKPHVPPQNDEDIRRAKLRGHHANAMGLDNV